MSASIHAIVLRYPCVLVCNLKHKFVQRSSHASSVTCIYIYIYTNIHIHTYKRHAFGRNLTGSMYRSFKWSLVCLHTLVSMHIYMWSHIWLLIWWAGTTMSNVGECGMFHQTRSAAWTFKHCGYLQPSSCMFPCVRACTSKHICLRMHRISLPFEAGACLIWHNFIIPFEA